MPRNHQSYQNFADISVKDFADAAISSKKVRIRKHVGKTLTLEENFEALDIEYPEAKTKPMEKSTELDEVNNNHIIYPNEVWFLISEKIQPEDVGRFALICKQTYHITTTMKFWRNLYLRYYDANIEMPVRLQKDCMIRPGGIRACTIRSLFYTYPLFVDRLIPTYSEDTNTVLNRRVVNYWYQQLGPEQFRFFYILKRPLVPGSNTYQSDQLQRQDEKSLTSLRDIYSNPDEGCSILVIKSKCFQLLPRLEELGHGANIYLASIALRLSNDLTYYKCILTFASISKEIVASVCIEPSICIKVYDWWVPNYTKLVHAKSSKSVLLAQNEDSSANIDDPWYD